jgi:KUP system potassium uptake protein
VAGLVTGGFLIIDGLYFASNLTKVPDGGWFPLLVAAIAFTLLTTWARGRRILRDRLGHSDLTMDMFIASTAKSLKRVSGTAIFMSASPTAVPTALLHNVKHNKVLHERVVVLTVKMEQVPHVPIERRIETQSLPGNFYRVILHFGFMDEANIPAALTQAKDCNGIFRAMDTSYFLGRQTLIPSAHPGMALWREQLFAWMVRNAESAMEFFRLPTNRVVELGSQVEI